MADHTAIDLVSRTAIDMIDHTADRSIGHDSIDPLTPERPASGDKLIRPAVMASRATLDMNDNTADGMIDHVTIGPLTRTADMTNHAAIDTIGRVRVDKIRHIVETARSAAPPRPSAAGNPAMSLS
ncbi:hypothetical protein DFR70_10561 [Nocardia tenerifensis]|uniref:Uncharacterized protein n=1 Tax=Nocardia tenerifensis TaxID=228006 RepID=A0A318JZK4_9NOCA|nr:hypothetical protein [Nocardia tenerifensis]PXX63879.1 hypothetical protein DFR70_10561 [Nocardia tenerifensis]